MPEHRQQGRRGGPTRRPFRRSAPGTAHPTHSGAGAPQRPPHGGQGTAHGRGHGHSHADKDRRGGKRRGGRTRPPEKRLVHHRVSTEESVKIPPLAPDSIRIIHLGGVEEIGRNMSLIEYGDDIIVVDAGIQFSEDTTPGIDAILPNTRYLEERRDKVRAMFITHGHLDHIGGIPYVMEKIGNPPIYARNFTALMMRKRQEEFPHVPPLDLRVVETDAKIKAGNLTVSLFGVTHSIPDAMGIILATPHGDIVHTGDLRLDHSEGQVSEIEEEVYKTFKDRNVLLLQTDSTNAENPGFSISEKLVQDNIEKVIRDTPGRLIVSTFASQVERMLALLKYAEKHGRKVVVDGRSMKTNIEVVKAAGLLTVDPKTIIPVEEMAGIPENKIMLLVTGAQGEEFAALMRISNKTHKYIQLSSRDTVLMSSSVIPGNERAVQKLKDNISRQGAHIIHYKTSDIHSSGHANSDELAWIHSKIHPKFFVPIHGYHYMLRVHADIAVRTGVLRENIVIPDNSMVIEIQEGGKRIVSLKEKAPSNVILVDGFSVGDIQHVVLRDRQTLAEEGMFVVVAIIDMTTGRLRKSPDIISRGFVYLRESQELLREARNLVKHTVETSLAGMHPINFDFVKDKLTDDVERFLLQRTAKRPIVIPVLLGV